MITARRISSLVGMSFLLASGCADEATPSDPAGGDFVVTAAVAGQSCNSGTFTTRCQGNSLVTCQSGVTVVRECGSNTCNAVAVSCGYCGDGVLDPGEACDDANTNDNDACHGNCTLARVCNPATFSRRCQGNALVVCSDFGFEVTRLCDPGICNAADARCGVCGDGVLDPGEQCDDANTNAWDGCSSGCTLVAPCDPAATPPRCEGNTLVTCDDGSEARRDCGAGTCNALAADCGYCGNGALDPAEACDDANTVEGDGCDSDCSVSACGNGILAPNEVCDDGNTAPGDGCRADCLGVEVCGDGLVDPGEACDGSDDCNPDCTLNRCLPALSCDDGVECTLDYCDPTDGCHNVTDDSRCDDGSGCTIDVCVTGVGCNHTESCDDGVACTIDYCFAGTCVQIPNAAACDDGTVCTADTCTSTGCEHSSSAQDGDVCQDGAAVCASYGLCVDGTCEPGPELRDCDDGDSCTSDYCDFETGCRHDPVPRPAGDKVCGDGTCAPADPAHGCGLAGCDPCPALPNAYGTVSCEPSSFGPTVCALACPSGTKTYGWGCFPSDADHGCGSDDVSPCVLAHATGALCDDGGACDYTGCEPGWEDLDGNRHNGCESQSCNFETQKRCPDSRCYPVDDPATGCGSGACEPCSTDPNESAYCSIPAGSGDYACVSYCNAGFSECPTPDGPRCIELSPYNGCGADPCSPCHLRNVVGAFCNAYGECDYGSCALDPSSIAGVPGWADLDGDRSNGCESPIECGDNGSVECGGEFVCQDDPEHGCGTCTPCPEPGGSGFSTCELELSPIIGSYTWQCDFGCNPGYKACGGECVREAVANGCGETTCFPCGFGVEHVTGQYCDATGGCAYSGCQAGYEDADRDPANGCEVRSLATTSVQPYALFDERAHFAGSDGLVTAWADMSGRKGLDGYAVNVQMEKGGGPYFISGPTEAENWGGTGLDCVHWDGSNGPWTRALFSNDILLAENGDYTIFAVVGRTSDRSGNWFLGEGGPMCDGESGDCNPSSWLVAGFDGPSAYWTHGAGGADNGIRRELAPVSGLTRQLVSMHFEPAGRTFRILGSPTATDGFNTWLTNGGGTGPNQWSSTMSPNLFYLGAAGGFRTSTDEEGNVIIGGEVRRFEGDICEVIIYMGPLTTTDRDIIWEYLVSKWHL